jgi:hypothetical protein
MVCDQATTFNVSFVVQTGNVPWDLTGYDATMTIRPFVGSTETTLLATNGNGLIVLGTVDGDVSVTFSAATTAALEPGRYAYDFVFDSGGVVTRLLEGKFIVVAGVTV